MLVKNSGEVTPRDHLYVLPLLGFQNVCFTETRGGSSKLAIILAQAY